MQSLKSFESSVELQRLVNEILMVLKIEIHICLTLHSGDDGIRENINTVRNFIHGNVNLNMKRLSILDGTNEILDSISEVRNNTLGMP